jgi:hypothetical protein
MIFWIICIPNCSNLDADACWFYLKITPPKCRRDGKQRLKFGRMTLFQEDDYLGMLHLMRLPTAT